MPIHTGVVSIILSDRVYRLEIRVLTHAFLALCISDAFPTSELYIHLYIYEEVC